MILPEISGGMPLTPRRYYYIATCPRRKETRAWPSIQGAIGWLKSADWEAAWLKTAEGRHLLIFRPTDDILQLVGAAPPPPKPKREATKNGKDI